MTNKKELLSIGIRLIVFLLIVVQLSNIPLVFIGPLREILFKFAFLLLLFGLWLAASWLAQLIIQGYEDSVPINFSIEAVQVSALTMIGLWLFLNALPEIVLAFLCDREAQSVLAGGGSRLTSNGVASINAGFIKLILGALVFVLPSKILGAICKLQKIQWIKD